MKAEIVKPNTFRVPVAIPLEWKVKAVAEYKRRNKMKKAQNVIIDESGAAESFVLQPNTVEYQAAEAKLEQLYLRGQELRNDLQSLYNVKSSLLWLLKKANTLEVQRNHNHSNNTKEHR